jgi:hypothetical protein
MVDPIPRDAPLGALADDRLPLQNADVPNAIDGMMGQSANRPAHQCCVCDATVVPTECQHPPQIGPPQHARTAGSATVLAKTGP